MTDTNQLKQVYFKNALKIGEVKELAFSVNEDYIDRIIEGTPVEVYFQDENEPIKIPDHNIAGKVEKSGDSQ